MIGADMSRRNTKEEIIDATLELASQNGLGNVSMQQIADKVGIRKASLYNHYPSKEDLIESMYESIRQSSKEKASIIGVDYDALAEKGTIKAVLTTAVESYWRIVSDPQMNRFYRVVMNERTVSGTAAEIMVRETRLMIDSTEKLFRALEDKGKAAFSNRCGRILLRDGYPFCHRLQVRSDRSRRGGQGYDRSDHRRILHQIRNEVNSYG